MAIASPHRPTNPPREADHELMKKERYRQAAAQIQEWMAAEDDSDILVLAEMNQHLRLNPVKL